MYTSIITAVHEAVKCVFHQFYVFVNYIIIHDCVYYSTPRNIIYAWHNAVHVQLNTGLPCLCESQIYILSACVLYIQCA